MRRSRRCRTWTTSSSVRAGSGTKRTFPPSRVQTPSGTTQWKCTFKLSALPKRWTKVTSRAADALPSCAESLPGKDATQREL